MHAEAAEHSLQVNSNIARSELQLEQTVDLHCNFEPSSVLQSYNTLQWLDGELPIRNSSNRELIENGNCGLTLRIHNFSIRDFGIYTCRCFNLYNFWELEEHTNPVYCSQPSRAIELLPNGMYQSEVIIK